MGADRIEQAVEGIEFSGQAQPKPSAQDLDLIRCPDERIDVHQIMGAAMEHPFNVEPVFGCLAVLLDLRPILRHQNDTAGRQFLSLAALDRQKQGARHHVDDLQLGRSEEHTSELQSLMRSSYAVFCLKKKIIIKPHMI